MVNNLYPFTGQTFDNAGHEMHYVDEGEGANVLMVHGNPTWSFYWRDLIKALRGDYRVIAPDHIGCGRSAKPSADDYNYTMRTRVDDLGRLVDKLDLDDITLVVHDWGGAIGSAWAVEHADRIKRLVVLNTGAFHLPAGKGFPPSLKLARTPVLGDLLVRGGNAFVRGANRFCMTRNKMSAEVRRGYLEPYGNWSDRVAVHRFVQDIPLGPADPAYSSIEATAQGLPALKDKPMFIGWGMRDFVFDHHFLAEWERRFPAAQVHRFEDCGHYVLEDAGAELIGLIGSFIADDSQRAQA